ncbi:MAG: TonB-dependent receptor [Verrucomicrobia bacterium]|nr:TonB-dependent receptor [Verrucomicrobiota bacterium]
MNHTHRSPRGSLLRTLPLLGTALALAAAPVFAQTSAGVETATKLEPFEVTGSNIKRVDFEGPSPIIVLNRVDIERSGAATVFELLKKVPGNFAQVINETRSNPPRSNAAINLRGLGGNATLVLVNGRRVASDAFPTTAPIVNLHAIPIGAVERVDILKDGASAIYGSDAIAGVVNFVLKKDYTGTQVTVGYGNTFDSDVGEKSLNVLAGGASGKFRGLISFDYFDRNELMNVDRDNQRTADQRFRGGADGRSTTGNPGAVVIVNATGSSPYRAASAATATATKPANGRWVIPTTQAVNGRPTIAEFIAAGTVGNASAPRYDFAPEVQLVPGTERTATTANFGYDVAPQIELYGELTFSNVKGTELLASTPVTTQSTPQVIVPATHPFNPFGEALVLDYRLTQLGPRTYQQETDTTRYLLGAKGTVFDKWSWDTGAMRTKSHYVQVGKNFTSTAAVQAAINDPNPATVLNPFAVGKVQNAATIDALRVAPIQDSKISADTLDAKISGSLLTLPGGDLGLAVGGSRVAEKYDVQQDGASARGEIAGGASAAYNPGSRRVWSLFAELSVPVIKQVEIQLAGRFEDYSDFGTTTKPKAGIVVRPLKDLVVRTTYSEGFRAPSLQQLYQSASRGFPTVRDTTRYNVTRAPEDNSFQYPQTGGGNPNLKPEESKSYSAGFVYEPRQVKGLTLSADFFKIRYTNQVATVATQTALDNPGQFPGVIITRETSTALPGVPNSGRILSIFNGLQNLADTEVQGYDLEGKYVLKTANAGTFNLTSSATFLERYLNRATPISASYDYAGGVGTDDGALPKWRVISSVFWTWRDYGVGVQHNYIGRYSSSAGAAAATDYPVDAYSTFDVQTTWAVSKRYFATVGVRNVLDESAPFFNRGTGGTYGFDPSVADTRGRTYYVRLTTKF